MWPQRACATAAGSAADTAHRADDGHHLRDCRRAGQMARSAGLGLRRIAGLARWREHVAALQYDGRLARQPARPFADHRVLAAGPARGLPGPAAGPVGAAARIQRPLLHPLPPLQRHPRIAPHRAEAHTDRMNPRAAGAARPTSSPPNGTTPARPDHDRFETFYFIIRGGPPCGMTAGYFATRRRRRDRPAAVAAR